MVVPHLEKVREKVKATGLWIPQIPTEYVLRRPPVGAKVKSGHDMGPEYRILCGLKFVNHKVPAPFYYSEDLTREEIIHQYELKLVEPWNIPFFIMSMAY